jgi:hypothetical protein
MILRPFYILKLTKLCVLTCKRRDWRGHAGDWSHNARDPPLKIQGIRKQTKMFYIINRYRIIEFDTTEALQRL